MNKKNLKKYSGLSIFMGGILTLSGCGVVKKTGESNSFETSSIVTTVETTTEPFAYAGYGYKQYLKNKEKEEQPTTDVEPTTESFASAGEYVENKNEEVVEPTTEPFAYAGYGYKQYLKTENKTNAELNGNTDILYSSYVMSMDCKYVYSRYDDFYKITDEDSIEDICNRFNISTSELYSHNPKLGAYPVGTTIAYPVMEELYLGHIGDNIEEIAIETGVDIDIIKSNNKLNLSGSILNEESQISLHKFIGNENSYVTNKGVVNIINNNRIFGDKIIQASGFAGASSHYLALNESVYSYGVNDVMSYTFYDDDYKSEFVCSNAKDIISVDGMPIALLRNDSDIKTLADSVNVPVDDMAYMQWGSNVSDSYSICTSGENSYVVMNGMNMGNLDLSKSYTKTK